MGKGGRFGKYGDTKRNERLRQARPSKLSGKSGGRLAGGKVADRKIADRKIADHRKVSPKHPGMGRR